MTASYPGSGGGGGRAEGDDSSKSGDFMLRSGDERVWNTLPYTERRMEAIGVKVREAVLVLGVVWETL